MFHTHPASFMFLDAVRGATEAGWEALENIVVYFLVNVTKTCKIVVFELSIHCAGLSLLS
jgi:hypothetical protein